LGVQAGRRVAARRGGGNTRGQPAELFDALYAARIVRYPAMANPPWWCSPMHDLE